jgi:hypothetical protein
MQPKALYQHERCKISNDNVIDHTDFLRAKVTAVYAKVTAVQ